MLRLPKGNPILKAGHVPIEGEINNVPWFGKVRLDIHEPRYRFCRIRSRLSDTKIWGRTPRGLWNLTKAFNVADDKDFDMLLIFDEARYLTDTSAIDGEHMPSNVEYQEEPNIDVEKKPSEYNPFCNII